MQQVYDEHHGLYGCYQNADVMHRRDVLDSDCRNTLAVAMLELGS